jgi:HNH endonuclease
MAWNTTPAQARSPSNGPHPRHRNSRQQTPPHTRQPPHHRRARVNALATRTAALDLRPGCQKPGSRPENVPERFDVRGVTEATANLPLMGNPDSGRNRNFVRVMKRDKGICQYCGGPAGSVDHIVPWSYRHNNSMSNLVAACMRCNLAAHDMVFPTFAAKREFILTARKVVPIHLAGATPIGEVVGPLALPPRRARPVGPHISTRYRAPLPKATADVLEKMQCPVCDEFFMGEEAFDQHQVDDEGFTGLCRMGRNGIWRRECDTDATMSFCWPGETPSTNPRRLQHRPPKKAFWWMS